MKVKDTEGKAIMNWRGYWLLQTTDEWSVNQPVEYFYSLVSIIFPGRIKSEHPNNKMDE